MNDLQPIHCRLCQQTYMTTSETIAAQKCDMCGRFGGLMDAKVAAEADRERFIERAAKQTPMNRWSLPTNNVVAKVTIYAIFVLLFAFLTAFRRGLLFGSGNPRGWFFLGLSLVGLLIIGIIWVYREIRTRKKQPPPESSTQATALPSTQPDHATHTDNIPPRDDRFSL